MKKSRKLKWLLSLSSISLVAATVPVVATSCSDDDEVQYLTDIEYRGQAFPGQVVLAPNGAQLYTLNDFDAKYNGNYVELKEFTITPNDPEQQYVACEKQSDNAYKISARKTTPPSGYVIFYFDFVDVKGRHGYVSTRFSVASNALTNIKYNGEQLPTTVSVEENDSYTYEASKFSANSYKGPTSIKKVSARTNEVIPGTYVKIENSSSGDSCTITTLKGMTGFIYLYVDIEDYYGNVGTWTIKLEISHDWKVDTYFYDEATNKIMAVESCDCKESRIVESEYKITENDAVISLNGTAISTITTWVTQSPDKKHVMFLQPWFYNGGFCKYVFLKKVTWMPLDITFVGLSKYVDGKLYGATMTYQQDQYDTPYINWQYPNGVLDNVCFDNIIFDDTVVYTGAKSGTDDAQGLIKNFTVKNCTFNNSSISMDWNFPKDSLEYVENPKVTIENCEFKKTSAQLQAEWENENDERNVTRASYITIASKDRHTPKKWATVPLQELTIKDCSFDGSVWNASQVDDFNGVVGKVDIQDNYFANIWNRPIVVAGSEDTEFTIANNTFVNCNKEDKTTKTTPKWWQYYPDQIIRVMSQDEWGSQVTTDQYLNSNRKNNIYYDQYGIKNNLVYEYVSKTALNYYIDVGFKGSMKSSEEE